MAGACLAGYAVLRLVSLDAPHDLGTEAVRALEIAKKVRGARFVEGNPGYLVAPQHSLPSGEGIGVDSPPTGVADARTFWRQLRRYGRCRGHRVLSLGQNAVWYAPSITKFPVMLGAYHDYPG